jgi:hypothetical protein
MIATRTGRGHDRDPAGATLYRCITLAFHISLFTNNKSQQVKQNNGESAHPNQQPKVAVG